MPADDEDELSEIARRLGAQHAEQRTEALECAERDAIAGRIFELGLAAEEIVGKEKLDAWLDENVPGFRPAAPAEAPDAHVKLRTPVAELAPAEITVTNMEQAAVLPFHPLADLFPLLRGHEFDDLVADIKVNGLHDAVVLLEGQILDGRNRYRACIAAGIEPRFTPLRDNDALVFVISKNLKRRHLSVGERASIASKLATSKPGGQMNAQICASTQADAADLLNVSRRAVQQARNVQMKVRDGKDRNGPRQPRSDLPDTSRSVDLRHLPVLTPEHMLYAKLDGSAAGKPWSS